MSTLSDIQSVDDIEMLVEAFYKVALSDELIGHFFTEVIPIDFETHIPVIISFWNAVLLDQPDYKGNPILKHIAIHRQSKLNETDFDRWIAIWTSTILKRFKGEKANEAIQKAKTMKMLMLHKIEQSEADHFIQ